MAKYNKYYVVAHLMQGVSEYSKEDIKNKSVLIRSMVDFKIFVDTTPGVEMIFRQVDNTCSTTLHVDQEIVNDLQAQAFIKEWSVADTVDFIFTDWISYSGMYDLNLPKDLKKELDK